MNYIQNINRILKPQKKHIGTVLDLFAGCGGLSLGFEAQGFKTIGFEKDKDCVKTYNKNLLGKCYEETLVLGRRYNKADIIIGGPPCQPFSVGGKQKGIQDSRDGFPIFIEAIKQIQPKIVMFENVRGLFYKNRWYLDVIKNAVEDLGYKIKVEMLNAKKFGVPQNRERIFFVGFKSEFNFPETENKIVTAGEALGEMAYSAPKESKFLTESMDKYIAKYEKASKCINPRDLHLDKPARTLTCRNLAGATGDMHRILLSDGRRRRILIREAARLQSFPDWFEFEGAETKVYYQIGNAVPPLLAYKIAGEIKKTFLLKEKKEQKKEQKKHKQMDFFLEE